MAACCKVALRGTVDATQLPTLAPLCRQVKFTSAGDTALSQVCDNYLSYAELLRILIINKCGKKYLVSLQQLDSKDKARRLRDALTEEHRFPLAMEVATKCQVRFHYSLCVQFSHLSPTLLPFLHSFTAFCISL